MPPVQGPEVPVAGWNIPPRRSRPGPPQDPVDHLPVIVPPTSPTRRPVRQQRLQSRPLCISQIVTIEHKTGLPGGRSRSVRHALEPTLSPTALPQLVGIRDWAARSPTVRRRGVPWHCAATRAHRDVKKVAVFGNTLVPTRPRVCLLDRSPEETESPLNLQFTVHQQSVCPRSTEVRSGRTAGARLVCVRLVGGHGVPALVSYRPPSGRARSN